MNFFGPSLYFPADPRTGYSTVKFEEFDYFFISNLVFDPPTFLLWNFKPKSAFKSALFFVFGGVIFPEIGLFTSFDYIPKVPIYLKLFLLLTVVLPLILFYPVTGLKVECFYFFVLSSSNLCYELFWASLSSLSTWLISCDISYKFTFVITAWGVTVNVVICHPILD